MKSCWRSAPSTLAQSHAAEYKIDNLHSQSANEPTPYKFLYDRQSCDFETLYNTYLKDKSVFFHDGCRLVFKQRRPPRSDVIHASITKRYLGQLVWSLAWHFCDVPDAVSRTCRAEYSRREKIRFWMTQNLGLHMIARDDLVDLEVDNGFISLLNASIPRAVVQNFGDSSQ